MEEKFSLKVIQNGQTKLARAVRTGAGANGQALVIKVEEAATFQLMNQVTLTSPAKLQFKRKANDLHVSLPGGDVDMPDVVIQNYFGVEGNALKGISQSGEWMSYDTSVFVPKPLSAGEKPPKPINPDSPVAIGLTEPPMALLGKFDSPLGLAAIGSGAVAVGILSSKGSGGSSGSTSTSTTATDNFAVFKNYAGSTAASAVAPTAAQYTTAGVTVPTVDSVSAANVLAALNQVISGKTATDVSTKDQLQTIADALKTSWALIIAEANGSTTDATPSSSPTTADYLNVGVKVGTTTKALDLLNSALGELATTNVDTADEIKKLSTAADNVMKVASGVSGASLSKDDLTALGLKINGANSGISKEQADALATNLANLLVSLGKASDSNAAKTSLNSGEAVDTYAELQAIFSLQAMRSYNDDTAVTKTQTAPGVIDYTNIGIKSYASLADSTAATPNRIDLDAKNFSKVDLQTTLNSALDNQASGTALTKTVVQTMVDAYYKVLNEAGSTTSSAGTYVETTYKPGIDEFKSLGITHVDKTALVATDTSLLSLLNSAIGRLSASAVDTASEIQALEKAAENILAQGTVTGTGTGIYGVSYTADSDWLTGFSALGVTGVTASNLAGIKTAIDSKVTGTDVSGIDTLKELQAIVSMYRINYYADDDTNNPIPTLADYQAILYKQDASFLTNALSANLSAYNDAVRTKPVVADHKTFVDESKVLDMVKSFDTILKFADGSSTTYINTAPVESDFVNVGVGNGLSDSLKTNVTNMLKTSEYTNLLADVIGGKNASQVNTISQLNELASIIERISELEAKSPNDAAPGKYTSITGGSLSVADLDLLGLTTYDSLKTVSGTTLQNRLNYIYDNLIKVGDDAAFTKASFDSVLELNALIKASANQYPV